MITYTDSIDNTSPGYRRGFFGGWRKPARWLTVYWPVAAFLIVVLVYSLLFLPDGYSATDEGYLQSLGARVLSGELPYRDFYFLRPPLSIYIQAGLIALLGESYGILEGRVYWTLQMALIALMLAAVVSPRLHGVGRFLALLAAWVFSSLYISFPWYSYDGAFLALLALFLVCRRRWWLAGAAMALAALCKQNYLLLLPGFLVVGIVIDRIYGLNRLGWKPVAKLAVGFALPMAIFFGHLEAVGGGIGPLVDSLFVLPSAINEVTLTTTLFQNNGEAFLTAIPVVLLVALLYWLDLGRWWSLVLAVPILVWAATTLSESGASFVYCLVFANYTMLLSGFVQIWRKRRGLDTDTLSAYLTPMGLALLIQYLAGFNYVGLMFSYMGSAAAFVIGWASWQRQGPTPTRYGASLAVLILLLGFGTGHKYSFMARDYARPDLTAQFEIPRLKGIRSTERNVNQIEAMARIVEEHTEPGDHILVFPDFPSLYYLTDRRNPTRIGWYVLAEFCFPMMQEALRDLEAARPRVVFVQTYSENDFRRERPPTEFWKFGRYRPLYAWLSHNYRQVGYAGDVAVLVPPEYAEAFKLKSNLPQAPPRR